MPGKGRYRHHCGETVENGYSDNDFGPAFSLVFSSIGHSELRPGLNLSCWAYYRNLPPVSGPGRINISHAEFYTLLERMIEIASVKVENNLS